MPDGIGKILKCPDVSILPIPRALDNHSAPTADPSPDGPPAPPTLNTVIVPDGVIRAIRPGPEVFSVSPIQTFLSGPSTMAPASKNGGSAICEMLPDESIDET